MKGSVDPKAKLSVRDALDSFNVIKQEESSLGGQSKEK